MARTWLLSRRSSVGEFAESDHGGVVVPRGWLVRGRSQSSTTPTREAVVPMPMPPGYLNTVVAWLSSRC